MSKKSSLGRGLEALLGSVHTERDALRSVSVRAVHTSNLQPRQHFDPKALEDLAASIREKGVLQPLLVRPFGQEFELIAGERRLRASILAGLTEVPVIVRDLKDREALEIAIIENLQRENLNCVEEAQAYARLLEGGLSQEQVAQAVGKGRSTIANALRLLQLPGEVLAALESGDISAGHARAILALPEKDRLWGLKNIQEKQLSVRQAELLKRIDVSPKLPKVVSAFHSLELDLSRNLGTRVRIAGNVQKGKVELSFNSQEELEHLLQRLGCET